MLSLTYDLWNAIIEDVTEEHAPIFEAMRTAADKIQVNRDLVEELKLKGVTEIMEGALAFLMTIELHDDGIGGFMISLIATESLDALEEIEDEVTESHGFTYSDIENFEAEHGLDLSEEVFKSMEEGYSITVRPGEEIAIFEMVVFDSEDIDDSINLGNAWPSEDIDSVN